MTLSSPSSPYWRCLGPCLALCPDYTFVLEDELGVCGCVLGVLDVRSFAKRCQASWMPAMRDKYPSKSAHHNTQVRRTDSQQLFMKSHVLGWVGFLWNLLWFWVNLFSPLFVSIALTCTHQLLPNVLLSQVSPAVIRQHSSSVPRHMEAGSRITSLSVFWNIVTTLLCNTPDIFFVG